MKHLQLYEQFVVNELSDKELKYWSLYAHVSDFLSKAKNLVELKELKQEELFKKVPADVINFFFQYFVKVI